MALVIGLPENRPVCTKCNKNGCCMSGNPRKDGTRYFKTMCQGCYTETKYGKRHALKEQWHKPGMAYKKHKKDYCEECGFKGHYCQLDVDHVDGNHKNDEISNLKTLCANCHRLKSFKAKDNHSKQWRGNA